MYAPVKINARAPSCYVHKKIQRPHSLLKNCKGKYDAGLVHVLSIQDLIGPVNKTNLVRTKSLSDHGPDQIWLCKRYLSVSKIWSGPRSDRIWSGTKSGYVNAPCLSDQTKSLTFGGKSQSSNKNGDSATWCKLVNR